MILQTGRSEPSRYNGKSCSITFSKFRITGRSLGSYTNEILVISFELVEVHRNWHCKNGKFTERTRQPIF